MRKHATGWRQRGRLMAGTAAASALLAGTGLAAAPPAAAAQGPLAVTHSGVLQGKVVNGISEFLGIPYAAPPVGALRWHAPEPAARWAGIRAATAFGPHCPQTAGAFGVASTSENCLFLNVFSKGAPFAFGRPVMVWIHGGALVSGESDDFDPTGLVNDGVTVVTINYRLGELGFLADSALADGSGAAGDYGLMDQQAALRWVRRNIAAFGGSPRDVTIFGESAGGLSVLSQVDSPLARGLFQRAIVESGSYNPTQAPLATAEATGALFAARTGCTQSSPADVAACLRALPVSTVLADQAGFNFTPDVDGRVLTQPILAALQDGQFNRVPLIMGTNKDEERLFVGIGQLEGLESPPTPATYIPLLEGTLRLSPAAAAQVAAAYPLSSFPTSSDALAAAGTDAIFACNSLAEETAASAFTPVFAYEFADENAPERFVPAPSPDFSYGSAHASELQYLFGLTTPIPAALTPAQQRLAAQMKGYWTSQARFGAPETLGQPLWPLFNATSTRTLSLDEPQPAVFTTFNAEHHCALWASLAG